MHRITKQDAKNAVAKLDAIKRRVAIMKDNAEKNTRAVVHTMESAVVGFGFGVLQGRTGGVEVFGLPVELVAGLGGLGFAILGGAGEMSNHVLAGASGALTAYTTTLGRGVGATWAAKDKRAKVSGDMLPVGGTMPLSAGAQSLTPAEVANMQAAGLIPMS